MCELGITGKDVDAEKERNVNEALDGFFLLQQYICSILGDVEEVTIVDRRDCYWFLYNERKLVLYSKGETLSDNAMSSVSFDEGGIQCNSLNEDCTSPMIVRSDYITAINVVTHSGNPTLFIFDNARECNLDEASLEYYRRFV